MKQVRRQVTDPNDVTITLPIDPRTTHVAWTAIGDGRWMFASEHRSEVAARRYQGAMRVQSGQVVIVPVCDVIDGAA